MDLWTLGITGVGVSAILTGLALFFFPRWKLLDFPERYQLLRSPKPYPGGLVFWVLALIFFFGFSSLPFFGAAILALGMVSFWDDMRPLPAWGRGVIHVCVAAFIFWQGIRIEFIGNPFSAGESFDFTSLPLLSAFLTILWIVVIQNALNWFDGVPGLSVGVAAIGFIALGVFGLVRQEVAWESSLPEFLRTSFYLAGICVGAFLFFLRDKIILGDTGSQILGFLLAVLSIFAGTKIATTLLVLGLPILDSVFVVFRRIVLDRKSPFKGDTRHLHHNLSRQIGPQKTAFLLLFLSAVLASVGIFLVGLQKILILVVVMISIWILDWWSLKKS
ncbi:undecaprenyl/decaprenyl-phosphate alpha-N-acetylglucosaminyl 1-phosphate transferase [Candidatus Gracilibacteria bacterium]|nr:undecaprenyl/decaprenyl-phosphate alpha-N-acetylglucosaminyl 1-phosphate transferase [Candidatus Gracilibacteria bacterium]MCF7819276.1 undecaprenyl/decaprenyl-phosphate alpha-N-acetylglucosaminyl 1-phosphate transferase [Candidatus Gracilibacteria bacterium]